jgi:DNA-binding transcriptional regulator YbjK
MYLRHAYGLSNVAVLARWVEDPTAATSTSLPSLQLVVRVVKHSSLRLSEMMHQRFSSVTEAEVMVAVLRFLSGVPTGGTSITTIKKALPSYLPLSARDKMPSFSRPQEQRWEQKVRNLVSHRNTKGNAIYEGLLEYGARYLAITDQGRAFLRQHCDGRDHLVKPQSARTDDWTKVLC